MCSLPATRLSLLHRLRQADTDQAAWAGFVARYGPAIHAWCRQWGLQETDAQDATQDVLVRLARGMRTFQYDPKAGSFRGWLRTVSRRAWIDFLDDRRRAGAGVGGADGLAEVAAADGLEEALDLEHQREVFDRASEAVRARVAPHTWEAFRLTAADGRPGADAAAELGMTVAAVFKAKSKVVRMLRDEVRKLGGDAPEDDA